MNSIELELLKRHALAHNDEPLLWLVEQAQKAERYETALKAIVQIGQNTYRTESELIAEQALEC